MNDPFGDIIEQIERTNAQLAQMEERHKAMVDRLERRRADETARIEALEQQIAALLSSMGVTE